MGKNSLLLEGKIPPKSICPFRVKCEIAADGGCHHTGYNHVKAFSCGAARAFDMTESRRVGAGQSPSNGFVIP